MSIPSRDDPRMYTTDLAPKKYIHNAFVVIIMRTLAISILLNSFGRMRVGLIA
jgi:hypothetical protein